MEATLAGTPARPMIGEAAPKRGQLVEDHVRGHYRPTRRRYLEGNWVSRTFWRRNILGWLRDHIHPSIPRWYYTLMLGHDLHLSTFAALYVRHFHANEPDPFTGKIGWWENIGIVSHGKVTVEFRDFQVDGLVSNDAEMGDFNFHRVGTDNTAEDNTDTTLVADSGITTAGGSQIEGATADIYKSVSTITADDTETWEEHALNSQTGAGGGILMDRSLISPNVSVVPSDTVEFTYELTVNAEA